MRFHLKRVLVPWLLIVLLMLAGCSQEAPATPAVPEAGIPTPETGKTVVVGQVVSNASDKPIKQTPVYLAQVYWDADHKNAAFAVDIARSPGTFTDDNGFFQFLNVDPHEYVIVVGEVYGVNDIIRTSSGDARIHDAKGDAIFNAGVLKVKTDVESTVPVPPTAQPPAS
jgi:hypothetical protein